MRRRNNLFYDMYYIISSVCVMCDQVIMSEKRGRQSQRQGDGEGSRVGARSKRSTKRVRGVSVLLPFRARDLCRAAVFVVRDFLTLEKIGYIPDDKSYWPRYTIEYFFVTHMWYS